MTDALLIVDDEDRILRSIERVLMDSDLRILKANSGDEALRLLQKEELSVILSDNMMPGMKGIDLLSKAKIKAPDTVRILMTGQADLQTAIDAINKGEVFRFITKPWDNAELEEVIQEGVNRFRIIGKMRKADEASLLSIGQAIELKDPYTRGHCERVAAYSLLIAEKAGMSKNEQQEIKHGSWLHDCGKIGVSESILNKEGPLTEEEFEVIKNHPSWGAEIARHAQLPDRIVNIILYHHERYDGEGYPFQMSGDEIPLEARIVAVADVFDALTTDRPYRKAFGIREGTRHIEHNMRGRELDPGLVDLFVSVTQRLEMGDAA
jgi:putative nucleotidyltransferase with HDIG domain